MTAHTPLCAPLPCTLPALPPYDSEMDITDAWLEAFDPENETGATVIAYFVHREVALSAANNDPDAWGYGVWPETVAISIDTGEGPTFHSAEWARELFTSRGIDRFESAQFDAVNDEARAWA